MSSHKAVEPRHHDVKYHAMNFIALYTVDSLQAVISLQNLIALKLKIDLYRVHNRLVIVTNQYAVHKTILSSGDSLAHPSSILKQFNAKKEFKNYKELIKNLCL